MESSDKSLFTKKIDPHGWSSTRPRIGNKHKQRPRSRLRIAGRTGERAAIGPLPAAACSTTQPYVGLPSSLMHFGAVVSTRTRSQARRARRADAPRRPPTPRLAYRTHALKAHRTHGPGGRMCCGHHVGQRRDAGRARMRRLHQRTSGFWGRRAGMRAEQAGPCNLSLRSLTYVSILLTPEA